MGTPFTWGGAIIAGLAGTLVLTVIMYAAPRMGLPRMDIVTMLGAMVSPGSNARWLIGGMLHLMMGIVFALIYAAIWSAGLGAPEWWMGGIFGLVHGIVVSAVMPVMLRMYDRRLDVYSSASGMGRGKLISELSAMTMSGKTVIGLLMGHIVFGVVVALVYAGFSRPF